MGSNTTFIIDGFNLYHSVKEAEKKIKSSTKWLNIKSLCESYLHLIGSKIDGKAELEKIYYFSALATHLETTNPQITSRHRNYIKCLKDTGITVELSRFKKKYIYCPCCRKKFNRHEEKETDVALAVKLIEIFLLKECENAVLITGDTDVIPAVNAVKRNFPNKNIFFLFPHNRKNADLKKISTDSFEIGIKKYEKHQFPNPYLHSNGEKIYKPSSW